MVAGKSIHIYFTWNTYQKLLEFVRNKFGTRRALSLTVQQAVEEYLARQEDKQ